jgi:hypothetical protein
VPAQMSALAGPEPTARSASEASKRVRSQSGRVNGFTVSSPSGGGGGKTRTTSVVDH